MVWCFIFFVHWKRLNSRVKGKPARPCARILFVNYWHLARSKKCANSIFRFAQIRKIRLVCRITYICQKCANFIQVVNRYILYWSICLRNWNRILERNRQFGYAVWIIYLSRSRFKSLETNPVNMSVRGESCVNLFSRILKQ